MRLSGLFGFALLAMIIGGDIALADDVFAFVYLPAFLVCAFGTIGLSYLSYGALDTLRGLRALTWLVLEPRPDNRSGEDLGGVHRVLKGAVAHLYASGAAGTFIGVIKIMDFQANGMGRMWRPEPALLVLLPLFYALLLSEFLVRPAARRVEGLLKDSDR